MVIHYEEGHMKRKPKKNMYPFEVHGHRFIRFLLRLSKCFMIKNIIIIIKIKLNP